LTNEQVGITAELVAQEGLEQLIALGMITQVGAMLEAELRGAFCSLAGGEYAAVVAGGQSVSWLINQNRALTDAHADMPGERKQAIKDALGLCSEASRRRNTLIHSLKFPGRPGEGSMQTAQSRKGTRELKLDQWTIATVRETAGDLIRATHALGGAVENALSAKPATRAD
jgi:hypothetical protein